MTQGQRLALIIKENERNQSSFAEKLGMSRQYLSQLINDKRTIGTDVLTRVSQMYNVNASWILTGEGRMYNHEAQPAPSPVEQDDSRIRELEHQISSLKEEIIYLQKRLIRFLDVENGVEIESKRGNIPSVSLSVENGAKSLIIRHKEGQKDDDPLMMN